MLELTGTRVSTEAGSVEEVCRQDYFRQMTDDDLRMRLHDVAASWHSVFRRWTLRHGTHRQDLALNKKGSALKVLQQQPGTCAANKELVSGSRSELLQRLYSGRWAMDLSE